jgi:hypothetical protein
MKRPCSVDGLATVTAIALALLVSDVQSQGLLDSLKEREAAGGEARAKEFCMRAAPEVKCRIHYFADNYAVVWRGAWPGAHTSVEILVRGGNGAICSDIPEVNDYSLCFPLQAVK